MKNIYIYASSLRLLFHYLYFKFHPSNQIISDDIQRWLEVKGMNNNINYGFFYFMTFFPEFRNLFYHRIGSYYRLISWLCPKMNTLFIATLDVGSGLFLQHSFSTIIAAKSIGKNCWINQQVTIGYSNKNDCPTIQNNVTINAGAKVIGNITIGNNVVVGANAVVVKDVPENCVVAGVPARIIRKNGKRTDLKL